MGTSPPPLSLHLFLEEMIVLRENNACSAERVDKDNNNNNDKKQVYKLSPLSKGTFLSLYQERGGGGGEEKRAYATK